MVKLNSEIETSIPLSVIIVNYNSKKVLIDCLNSLGRVNIPEFETFVIDNASSESVKDLESCFPKAKFIYNHLNLGFAAANNIGISKSKGKYVLLLNPDTVVNEYSFQPMIEYLEGHIDVGIVGCKIYNSDGDIERSTHSFPTLAKEFVHANEFVKVLLSYNSKIGNALTKIFKVKSFDSYWDHNSTKEVDHVTGACMMVKREAIEKAGMLDEAFFLYTEEVEWSLRIKKAGYKSIFLPESNIIHLFGHSTKQRIQKQTINKLLVERYRGMLYFFDKHCGVINLFLLKLIIIEGFTFRLFINYIKFLRKRFDTNILLEERKNIKKILNLISLKSYDWRIPQNQV